MARSPDADSPNGAELVHSLDSRLIRLALGLALLAGFLDAAGFIVLGGIFVASPDTFATMLAVGVVGGWTKAVQVGLLVIGVVAGAVAGTWIMTGPVRRPRADVLGFVAGLVALALVLNLSSVPLWPGLILAAAIGMAHCALEGAGEPVADAMFVTHQLVRLGESLADICLGRKASNVSLPLKFGGAFVAGAAAAVFSHLLLGNHGLAPAIILSGLLMPLARAADQDRAGA